MGWSVTVAFPGHIHLLVVPKVMGEIERNEQSDVTNYFVQFDCW